MEEMELQGKVEKDMEGPADAAAEDDGEEIGKRPCRDSEAKAKSIAEKPLRA